MSVAGKVDASSEMEWLDCLLGEIAATRKEKAVATPGTACVELEHIEPETGRLLGCDRSGEQASIKTAFAAGDILFGKLRPYLRKYAIAPFDGICTTEVLAIYPKDEATDKSFLFYLMQGDSVFETVESLSYGTKMPRVSWADLSEIEIACPPLPEQQKIAAILTAVDDNLDLIARQISATQTLKQGLMQTLFTRGAGTPDAQGRWHPHTEFQDTELGRIPVGWRVTTLGAEVESIVGGGTPSKDVLEYWSGDIPWASVKDFVGTRLHSTEDRITEKAIKESASNLIPAGTLLTPTRMALGRVAFFDCDVAINQDIKAIFPKPSLRKEFLFYWFQLNASKIEDAGTGSTVKGIRLEVLRAFDLLLPPVAEQQKVVTILTSVDDKLESLTTQQTHYQSLKRGLMQKLLTGEWRVRVESSTGIA